MSRYKVIFACSRTFVIISTFSELKRVMYAILMSIDHVCCMHIVMFLPICLTFKTSFYPAMRKIIMLCVGRKCFANFIPKYVSEK